MTVITFGHAYLSGRTISLCSRHEADTVAVSVVFGPLGPVQFGAHEGVCEICEADTTAEQVNK